jgi:hypothetical protein
MDLLLIATTLLAVFGLVASAAGTDSRDGWDSRINGPSSH